MAKNGTTAMGAEISSREAVTKVRIIDADEIRKKAVPHERGNHGYKADIRKWAVLVGDIDEAPTIDAVPVVSGYQKGDVCLYGYGSENKSRCLVEIVKVLDDERGAAEVKFLKVFVDDSGNGLFDYLLKRKKTMNASFKYLKNITPRADGGKDDGQ